MINLHKDQNVRLYVQGDKRQSWLYLVETRPNIFIGSQKFFDLCLPPTVYKLQLQMSNHKSYVWLYGGQKLKLVRFCSKYSACKNIFKKGQFVTPPMFCYYGDKASKVKSYLCLQPFRELTFDLLPGNKTLEMQQAIFFFQFICTTETF